MMNDIPPTKEQIFAIKDIETLREWEAHLEKSISKMEVDLSFFDGDDDWHNRARDALTYHKIAYKNVVKQLKRITGTKTDTLNAEQILAKAAKIEAITKASEVHVERLKLGKESAAIKLQNRKINFIQQVSFTCNFMTCARNMLEPDVFHNIWQAANAKNISNITKHLEKSDD